jgi:hypothetical protein
MVASIYLDKLKSVSFTPFASIRTFGLFRSR